MNTDMETPTEPEVVTAAVPRLNIVAAASIAIGLFLMLAAFLPH